MQVPTPWVPSPPRHLVIDDRLEANGNIQVIEAHAGQQLKESEPVVRALSLHARDDATHGARVGHHKLGRLLRVGEGIHLQSGLRKHARHALHMTVIAVNPNDSIGWNGGR